MKTPDIYEATVTAIAETYENVAIAWRAHRRAEAAELAGLAARSLRAVPDADLRASAASARLVAALDDVTVAIVERNEDAARKDPRVVALARDFGRTLGRAPKGGGP